MLLGKQRINSDQLSMARGVQLEVGSVVSTRDDLSVANNHASYWYFPLAEGDHGLLLCELHVSLVLIERHARQAPQQEPRSRSRGNGGERARLG
jgi:hypothetical protein